jgi:Zn-dependent protease
MDLARARKQDEAEAVVRPSGYEYRVTFGPQPQPKKQVYFSRKEVIHLTVAGLLIIAVGISSVYYGLTFPNVSFATSALAFTVILMISFFTHEIAHKIMAQGRGLWSEFRLTLWGSLITLIFAFLPIKFISPGAVMIAGPADRKEIGEISIAGPIVNITLSALLLGIAPATGPLSPIFLFGGFFNGYMAAFNLVPFGILDGRKIFNWSKIIWGLAFAISVALTIAGYILVASVLPA